MCVFNSSNHIHRCRAYRGFCMHRWALEIAVGYWEGLWGSGSVWLPASCAAVWGITWTPVQHCLGSYSDRACLFWTGWFSKGEKQQPRKISLFCRFFSCVIYHLNFIISILFSNKVFLKPGILIVRSSGLEALNFLSFFPLITFVFIGGGVGGHIQKHINKSEKNWDKYKLALKINSCLDPPRELWHAILSLVVTVVVNYPISRFI